MIAFIVTLGEKMMMMIAFITINSGLVPLIEGLCHDALKSYISDVRLSMVCVHIFCFSFSEGKICLKKSS